MKVSYDITNGQSSYVTGKTLQPPINPFVIPSQEEIANEKTATQTTVANNFYDPFKAAKTGSVSLPEGMNTKTEPKRSDEEILKDIEALAKEHARTGKIQYNDPRFKELMDEYVSSVSPDRETILKNSTNEINERIASELAELAKIMSEMAGAEEDDAVKEAKRKNELLDYLMEAIDPKKGKHKEKNNTDIISSLMAARGNNITDRGDGKTTTQVHDGQGNAMPWGNMKSSMYNANVINGAVTSAFFYDGDGQFIMNYDDRGGLQQIDTREEFKRSKELQAVYLAVYDFSVGRYDPHEDHAAGKTMLTSVNSYEDARVLMKEIYDSIYERLRNEMLSSGVA